MISKRAKQIDFSGIRKVFDQVLKDKSAVKLNLGAASFPTPPDLIDNVIQAIGTGKNQYTSTKGLDKLRDKIKAELKTNSQITGGDVIVTAGASGALALAFISVLDPGDEIILIDPYFVAYKQLALMCSAKPIFVDQNLTNIEKVISKKTKAIVVNSPSNPTGKLFNKQALRKISAIAQKHNLTVISDETYKNFVFDVEPISIGSMHQPTITIQTFSKELNVTGWRIGCAHAPQELIDAMEKVQQALYVCPPAPFQHALAEDFRINQSEILSTLKKRRDLACKLLSGNFEFEKPDGGFFIFVKSPIKATSFCEQAKEKGVYIIPGTVFSEKDTHFRLSFIALEKDLINGIKILKSILINRKDNSSGESQ